MDTAKRLPAGTRSVVRGLALPPSLGMETNQEVLYTLVAVEDPYRPLPWTFSWPRVGLLGEGLGGRGLGHLCPICETMWSMRECIQRQNPLSKGQEGSWSGRGIPQVDASPRGVKSFTRPNPKAVLAPTPA